MISTVIDGKEAANGAGLLPRRLLPGWLLLKQNVRPLGLALTSRGPPARAPGP